MTTATKSVSAVTLVGEGFILLIRGYEFMGGVPPPFWHVKIGTSTDDIKLKLYR